MPVISVSIYSWENPKLFAGNFDLKKGDKVIVPDEFGNELGIVEDPEVQIKSETNEKPKEKILRIATKRDMEIYEKYQSEKDKLIDFCRAEVKKSQLPMKVLDARINLDGKQIIFVFTADGRIDFRDLVKNIAKEFKKTIRMQQIGSRDEARKLGGYGICGRQLCCVNFSGSLSSISTDMARAQQITHRGAERMSGLCGRLMCCLAYEAEQYKKMMEGMPELYSVVNTPEGKGTVMEINAISQEVRVKTEKGEYITFKKEELK